jgi:AraC family transcriptional regulator of arabinose operon
VLLVRRIALPGWTGPAHGPSDRHWTLVYTLAGGRVWRMRGASTTLRPDTLLLFRRESALQPAATKVPTWDCVMACFTGAPDRAVTATLERVGDEIYRADVTLPATRQRIRDAFARLLSDEHSRVAAGAAATFAKENATEPHDRFLRELMLASVHEILLLAAHDRSGTVGLDPRVRHALEIMARDLAGSHSLRSLSAAFDLSPSRFGHLFRAQLGVSPVRALRLMRLRQVALQLRYTSESVEWIAEETGFASPSHLSREFRRHFGMSPRTYRTRGD